mgnify:CR=1 FL=1
MNNNIKLTDLDLMAMFRVAKEIAGLDNNITVEEGEVFARYARPLNMSEGRMDRFISVAVNMDWQNAIDTLKEMSPELKQYASNFLAEVALADGEVSDEEDRAYNTYLEICDLPYTNIGQDDDSGTTAQSKYSKQELRAIFRAFLRVWDGGDASVAAESAFFDRYNVYDEVGTMGDDEADSVLYAMSDEKKAEVSQMLLDVILTKDPEDEVFCKAENIERYFDLVLSTGLPDLLTDHVLDYETKEGDGEQPEGLQFTLQDLYAIWSIADTKFYLKFTYVFDSFFSDFHVNNAFFCNLINDKYLKEMDFEESAERLLRFTENEKECVSMRMAETISTNIGEDEEMFDCLEAYKTLVEDYGLPDCLADFLDGHGISEYRTDKHAVITKVAIEPDLFIDGLSQTKIKVSLEVDGCKDGELRLVASVYYDDDTPVPDPDFMHYGNYSWLYDDVSVLSVYSNLFPSYDASVYTDLEMLLPNDFLPADRDYYIKVCVFDTDEQAFISYPFHTKGYRFKATKNEYDPDVITIEPTYIVVSYYERDRKKIPGDYRDYRPCTIRFEQLGLFDKFDKLMKELGANGLSSRNDTPELDQISEKLNLQLPGVDKELKLCIMYDDEGAHGYNKLRDLAGLGCNNDTFYETLVVCLQNKENDSTVYGFKYARQLREVLNALDEAVYGLAYNGPVYDQPALAETFKRGFWQQVETEIDKLNYESVKPSKRATETPPKSVKVTKTKVSQVVLNGETHVRLTMSCEMDGCKGLSFTGECEACYAVDGSTCETKDYNYMQGCPNVLCVSRLFKPSYDGSVYSDVEFDFPQRLLPQRSAYEFKISFYRNPTFQPIGNAVVVGSKTETPTNTGKASGTYNVIIKSAGAMKLGVIKLAMEIMHSDLKKAKDLVDTVPKTIKNCANMDEANAIKAKLEAAGAKVEITKN